MQVPSLSRRNVAIFFLLSLGLLTLFHLKPYSTLTDKDWSPLHLDQSLTEPPQPHSTVQPDDASDQLPPPPPSYKEDQTPAPPPDACTDVDFAWLASDRKYWDGWGSKAMFMKPDGNFTRKNVYLPEGDSICVVVLLGPIPAKSSIKPEEHLGPMDSIVMTAIGRWNKLSIELKQHARQTNVYYAPVTFMHADIYYLESRTEYRSYFWETPALHYYRPYRFLSQNKLAVRKKQTDDPEPLLPLCDFRNSQHTTGSWMRKTEYQRTYPLDFFGMFGIDQEDHAEDNRLFVPDHCRPQYISIGQAAQCLLDKTVHVYADANVRRNLKAFASGNRWCNDHQDQACVCNDDAEKHEKWVTDPTVPLVINETWHADTRFYFSNMGSIAVHDYKTEISAQAARVDPADIVILGFGNQDIEERSSSPGHFASIFEDLLLYLTTEVYPTQTIVVRTPQWFCCGTIESTSWNAGRSNAFARAVRLTVEKYQDRVLLWDVHRLGIPDNLCVSGGTPYSKRNVLNIENMMLWSLLCDANSS
ncbi:hypothetical protein BCR43DRAFT_561948 [Syncephalastrum racemosum]|uniref:SGNH hydrolase-type esterase domain-containing protein n=1 Tax=Syncephalastrum racemosum TaxID=13706 RepID=A0A1X2HHC1_SYNRA|nr:hypothetical protein BCR43DRAFT_561948 [Syncephalastrum racemosum]